MQEKQIAYIYKINDKFKQKQGIFTQLEKKTRHPKDGIPEINDLCFVTKEKTGLLHII